MIAIYDYGRFKNEKKCNINAVINYKLFRKNNIILLIL